MHRNHRTARGLLLAVCAVTLLAGAAWAEDEGPITLEKFDAALARAKAENRPVVLDFFTDW